MKNLTRILALVLVFTMMVSSAAFAARYTDVADDSIYAEAVEVLSAIGVVKGDTAGTFRPEDVITRAEVVAICNRLQGLSDAAKAAAGTSMYTDVATTDWFAGDVNLASQMGIVAGDGNGLFRPNDQVKYEEAVKMMVASLGYKQDYVLKQGGWPTGYLVIATQNEITKGLSISAGEPAHRGTVAKLAYQTLTAPLMTLSEYDDEGKATYKPVASSTLLGTKLGYGMAYGHVVTNEVSSLTSTEKQKKGYVDYKVDFTLVTDDDKNTTTVYKLFDGAVTELIPNASHQIKSINVGETDIKDTLGYATKAYFKVNDDDEIEVVTYVDSNRNNNVATIESIVDVMDNNRIDKDNYVADEEKVEYGSDIYAQDSALYGYISVYDEEVDSSNTEYKVSDAQIIYNGAHVAASVANFKTYVTDKVVGGIELLDNDGDGEYEYIFVTSYETAVVDSVFGQGKKIGLLDGGAAIDLTKFVEEKDGYTYSITLDGEEIAVTDLQKYDVLSIAADSKTTNYKIIVSRNVVEGAVESTDTDYTSALKYEYSIGGTTYKLAKAALANDVDVTTEGKFYIDAFDRIAYVEADKSISGNLAFVTGVGSYTSAGEDAYEIEVLNEDGSVAVYTLAEELYVKEGATKYEIALNDKKDAAVKVQLKDKDGNLVYEDDGTTPVYSEDKSADEAVAKYIENIIGEKNDNTVVEYAKRIVAYKANSANRITAIDFAVYGTTEGLFYTTATDKAYDASVNALGAYGIKDSTVIFNLPIAEDKTSKKDDFKVSSIASLVDETKYDVAYINIDDANNAGVIVITNDTATVGGKDSLAVVVGTSVQLNSNSEKVIAVTFLQNGEEKTLLVAEDADANDIENNPFERGGLFEYSLNADGDIEKVEFGIKGGEVVYTIDDVIANKASDDTVRNTDKKIDYVNGYVVAKSGSMLVLNNKFAELVDGNYEDVTNGDRLVITEGANIYTMDLSKTKVVPAVDAIGAITACNQYGGAAQKDQDTYVVVKIVDNRVTDVVVYNNINFKK